jgi:hypothetical protein
MPTDSTGSNSTSTEAFDTILVAENRKWIGSLDVVHEPMEPTRVAPLVKERLIATCGLSSFSRVSTVPHGIKIPRNIGSKLGNIWFQYNRAAYTANGEITKSSPYALDNEAVQSIAFIRMSYQGVEFYNKTGDQMMHEYFEMSDAERKAVNATCAGGRSVAERKIMYSAAQVLSFPVLTPWHNKFDQMFPLSSLNDDILVEIFFKEIGYVVHHPTDATANTGGAISNLLLNLDVYHEEPVKRAKSRQRFARGGGDTIKYVYDDWQLHPAEVWDMSSTNTPKTLKLDNITGQPYKLGVQVRAQKNVTAAAYLYPFYTYPLSLMKLQSNNRDIVVQEYHVRSVYGKTRDGVKEYEEFLSHGDENIDRQFEYIHLSTAHYDSINRKGGSAGTRQLSFFTAPTLTVTLAGGSNAVSRNFHAPAFVHEGGTNVGLAYTNKYLTVVAFCKNELVVGNGMIKRLYAMR